MMTFLVFLMIVGLAVATSAAAAARKAQRPPGVRSGYPSGDMGAKWLGRLRARSRAAINKFR